MRLALLLTAGIALVVTPAQSVVAEMKPKDLAACAVTNDLSAASALVEYETFAWLKDYNRLDAPSAIALRLLAKCATELPVERMPKWPRVRKELSKLLSKTSTSEGNSVNDVLLCASTAEVDGKAHTFKYEVFLISSGTETLVSKQHIAYHDEYGEFPLPRGLSVRPSDGAEVTVSCRAILEDGSLTHA